MSLGLGRMQRAIMEVLEEKGGRASTSTLKIAIGMTCDQNFYRALGNLQKRCLIIWYKSHGGINSPSGLVSIIRKSILLIDVDSVIPNLALMKISAHHKKQGHDVTLQRGSNIFNNKEKYDVVYISCIFTKNRAAARRLGKQFPNAEVHLGGTGINLTTELPTEIEHLMPDYNLYPEINYSLGYTSRGCFRSCPWCVVPKKEGKPHAVADIYQFYNPRFTKMILLDPNIFSVPHDHFKKIARQIIRESIQVEFNAGLDIRLLDDEKAELLHKMHISQPKFAWDLVSDEYAVMKGIEVLVKHGIKRSLFYVLTGFNTTMGEDLYRLKKLKSLGQRPYVLRYETVRNVKEYTLLSAWCNQPKFFETVSFDQYKMICKTREENRNTVPILEA